MIGKTLGHYQITNQLGKGGMGEVFQAKDQKLGRDVAIKVLPDEFARDADRVARFQREAKILASLNHPNIASIYGLEEFGGTNFLVLELVEGGTLADRIKAGPIPVEDALKLALQIAEALGAAHEKGVIHRDLKPANIKVTPDGKVKVLDFGLAKAYAGEQAESNLSASPTLSNLATQQGVILGTAAYMSPEQARGKNFDKRTDVWAFGCLAYEMLTGQAAFQGEDVTEILAAVVKGGANLDLLPADIHPRLREVIIRCMQKDLNRRYQDIGDVRYEIEQALADPNGVLVQPVTTAQSPKKLRTILPWAAVALVFGLIIAGLTVWDLRKPEPRRVLRMEYDAPGNQQLVQAEPSLAVSPDGRRFVYSTPKGLYLRSLDEFDAKLIVGTETNPTNPFFSPDGKWIGYSSSADRKLKKISVSGGMPVTLCDRSANTPVAGAIWGADDSIVFTDLPKGIARVSANGGSSELIVKGSFYNPQFLPDGKSLLLTSAPAPYKVVVQSLQSGERKDLFAGDAPRYIPTGHIIYGLGNNLFAVPFDPKILQVTGGPVPVIEGVWRAGPRTVPQYAVSDSGTLVYKPGTKVGAAASARTLVWVDRGGKEAPIPAAPKEYNYPNISPDGTKVALTVGAAVYSGSDIWTLDLVRKTLTRLTFSEASTVAPLWTRDGKRIAFSSGSLERSAVYWKAANGTGEEERLIPEQDGSRFLPWSWSKDGNTLLLNDAINYGIYALPIDGERKLKTLLREKYRQMMPKVSPDSRWMAYESNESGKREIYVRPFPEVNKGKWQVSANGGTGPLWSPNGRELFYRKDDFVMAVALETEPTFNPGKTEPLFQGKYASSWDINPDGKRFLMMKEVESTSPEAGGPRRIKVVVNWFEELKQRVPTK